MFKLRDFTDFKWEPFELRVNLSKERKIKAEMKIQNQIYQKLKLFKALRKHFTKRDLETAPQVNLLRLKQQQNHTAGKRFSAYNKLEPKHERNPYLLLKVQRKR